MTISALLAPSLLQPLSSSSKVVPLQKLQQPLQALQQSVASTSSSSASAQLAKDTYTPSAQTQATQNSGTSSSASSSNPTLADLIKNQTISGSANVRQMLLAATQSTSKDDPEATAWNELTDKVSSGDYSGAQTALADYSTALDNSHISMWADVSPIKSAMAALGSALQAGNSADVQSAFTTLTTIAPTHNLGLIIPAITGKTIPNLSWAAANMADALQTLGYTKTNAAAEANAWMLGYAADALTIHVETADSQTGPISDLSQVDQSIVDLAKGAAQSADKNMLSNILVGMSQANSVSAMESTLTLLDSKYGTAAQGAGNASLTANVSAYA